MPIIEGSPGFVAYFGVDHGDGDVATVSIFEDEAGAEESNRRAAGWVKDNWLMADQRGKARHVGLEREAGNY